MSNNNKSSKFPININLSTDLTKPIERISDESINLVKNPLIRLRNILDSSFGFFDETFKFGLNIYKYNLDYYQEKFKNKINKKIAEIKANDIVEPDIGIVCDIIENVKYNLDKDYLLDLYSSLIARNMDSKTKDLVHPLFVSIIKNLSLESVRLLKALYQYQEKDHSHYPIIELSLDNTKSDIQLDFKMAKYFIDIDDYNIDLNIFNTELEVLIELKLINADFFHTLREKDIYNKLLNKAKKTYLPITNKLAKDIPDSNFLLNIKNKGIINLSNIGFQLCTILFQ